jgi:hypothetical protein
MKIMIVFSGLALLVMAGVAVAQDEAPKAEDVPAGAEAEVPAVSAAQQAAGQAAFSEVYKVLMSPRCMNCHPSGDRPLQTDASVPHKMEISRLGESAGLECGTCHGEENSEVVGVAGGPPGAPHWGLPSREMPLVFQGRSPKQLCEQLLDPKMNGGRNLAGLMEHVMGDPLVLWGWNPGGDRTIPPMSHEAFVGHFKVWVESRGACPE